MYNLNNSIQYQVSSSKHKTVEYSQNNQIYQAPTWNLQCFNDQQQIYQVQENEKNVNHPITQYHVYQAPENFEYHQLNYSQIGQLYQDPIQQDYSIQQNLLNSQYSQYYETAKHQHQQNSYYNPIIQPQTNLQQFYQPLISSSENVLYKQKPAKRKLEEFDENQASKKFKSQNVSSLDLNDPIFQNTFNLENDNYTQKDLKIEDEINERHERVQEVLSDLTKTIDKGKKQKHNEYFQNELYDKIENYWIKLAELEKSKKRASK